MKYCSGCGGSEAKLTMEELSLNLYLCHSCIAEAYNKSLTSSVNESQEHLTVEPPILMTPKVIKQRLDEHVIGQELAKKQIAIAAYNHMLRVSKPSINGVTLKKSNVLLIGPSGTGKTLLVERLSEIIEVPFTTSNANDLTENGYIGTDIISMIESLYLRSGCDIEKTQKGIIFIDEIDKIARRKTASRSNTGEGVQHGLLKILEGTICSIDNPDGEFSNGKIQIDTKNILFICAGAFEGISELVEQENAKPSIGFTAEVQEKAEKPKPLDYSSIRVEHLLKFGMIKELLGRIPVIAPLEQITIETLKRILTEPKESIINEYKAIFSVNNTTLVVKDTDLESIAKEAMDKKLGARALRAIIEERLREHLFSIPGTEVKKVFLQHHDKSTGKKENAR